MTGKTLSKKTLREVIDSLRLMRSELPEDERDAKTFQQGRKCYTIAEIITEIESQTDFGLRYASNLVAAAKRTGTTVGDYLQPI